MTSAVVISKGGVSVDLSNYGVTVSYRMQNPLIAIPTPQATTGAANVYTINLTILQQFIDLNFSLPPTAGGPGTFNFGTPATDFERLGNICMQKDLGSKITLTINGNAISCACTSFTTSWEPGFKDLSMGSRMTLIMGAK